MSDENSSGPAAGWHDDPEDPRQLRYWDGQQWTEHRSPKAGASAQASQASNASGGKSGVPWWVWLIIGIIVVPILVIVLIAFLVAGTGDENDDATPDEPLVSATPTESSPEPSEGESASLSPTPDEVAEGDFGPGVWLVGDDIEAGTYRTLEPIEAEGIFDACYWSVEEDTSGDFEGIIANANVTGGIPTVTMVDGNQFDSSDCGDWIRVDPSELFQNENAPTTIAEGVWLVGEDIAPGTYRTDEAIEPEGDFDYCYWGITEGLEQNFRDIASNDLVEAGRPTVTLEAGQQFETSDCGDWTRQD